MHLKKHVEGKNMEAKKRLKKLSNESVKSFNIPKSRI